MWGGGGEGCGVRACVCVGRWGERGGTYVRVCVRWGGVGVHACVCLGVRACVRACVCVCVRVCASVRAACLCVYACASEHCVSCFTQQWTNI